MNNKVGQETRKDDLKEKQEGETGPLFLVHDGIGRGSSRLMNEVISVLRKREAKA